MNNIVKSKIKKVAFNIIKPFIPFLLVLLFIFGTMSTIVDAIYIQFVQEDDSFLSSEEKEIKKMCIDKANYLNTSNNFVNGSPTNFLLDVNSRENDKLINWSHLYSILTFHNMSNDEKINQKLLDRVGKHFKSTFNYITDTIKKEEKVIDEQGIESWVVVSEDVQYLLAESNSIVGHFTYTYKDFVEENETTRITKKYLYLKT